MSKVQSHIMLAGASMAAFLAFPLHAAAQDTSSDTIIVTGVKASGGFGERSGIPLDEVPQGVQVLDAEALAERNVRSIGDALRAVPSASVGTPRTSAYQSFSLRIRGFLADQMRNGVRQRYYEDVDASALTNVDRIEVLKGPSSVLFGQSAVGGVISIVTKRPEREFGGSVGALIGSFDQAAVNFDVTGPLSAEHGLFFRANGEIERSSTFVDFQDLDRENLGLSLTWAASPAVTAYVVGEWVERRTLRNPGLPLVGTVRANGVAEIPEDRFLGDPATGDLEAFAPLIQAWADVRLSPHWTMTPRLSYSGFDSNFTQLRVRAVEADGVTVNRTGRFGKEDDNYTIAQVDLTGEITLAGMTHALLIGAEYNNEQGAFYQEDIDAVAPINALDPVYGLVPERPYAFSFDFGSDVVSHSIYVQDLIDLTEAWNVVLGVRGSEFEVETVFNGAADDSKFDIVTYQVGSTLRLGGGFSLFGGFNTGFDIESSAGSRSADGRAFDPEESEQIEAGVRYVSDDISGSISAFEIKRTNVLTADPLNDGFSIQTGEVRVRGVELEGSWRVTENLFLQGGYAWMDSEVTRSNNGDRGDDVADTPEHQANLFMRYDVPNTPLQLRAGVNYVGERQFSNARVEVFPGLLASDVDLPDYVTLDIGAAYALGETRIELAITNLFDERYYTREFNDFSVFPGEPLQANLRVTRDF